MTTTPSRLELLAGRLYLVVELLLIIGFTVITISFLSRALPLIYAVGIPVFAIAAGAVLPFLGGQVRR